MKICLKKPHVIGYERASGTAEVARQMISTIKASLETQLKKNLEVRIDYKRVGINAKTLFNLYEPKKWKFLHAKAENKQNILLSIAVASCGEWAMNDISCKIHDPKISGLVFDKLQQYAEHYSLVVA